jgi:tetratricopeptide (TPR) repeat protein
VRDWKQFWPQALDGRGECAFVQRKYETANSHYQRIYVLYGHYKKWTARAYLRSAECLRKLYQNEKAIEVLREMLKNEDLKGLPEFEKGRTLFERLGGKL